MFIIPAASGHFNPLCPIANIFRENGDEVTFSTNAEFETTVTQRGFQFLGHSTEYLPYGDSTVFFDKQSRRIGVEVLQGVVEQLVKTLPAVIKNLDRQFRSSPHDLVVTDDYRSIVGAVLSTKYNVPWSTTIVTPIRQADPAIPPFGSGLSCPEHLLQKIVQMPRRYYYHRLYKPIERIQQELSNEYGVKQSIRDNHWLSPQLTLAFTTQEFDFPRRNAIQGLRYVGPIIDPAPKGYAFPLKRVSRSRRLIYVSLGTINNNHPNFFHAAIQGALDCDAEADIVVSVGQRVSIDDFTSYPDNVYVERYVDQLRILQDASVMISHGGMNSVSEALFYGVPLILFPVGADQPDVSQRLKYSGAGIVRSFSGVAAKLISADLREILDNEKYFKAAEVVSEGYRKAGGARKAEMLLRRIMLKQNLGEKNA